MCIETEMGAGDLEELRKILDNENIDRDGGC